MLHMEVPPKMSAECSIIERLKIIKIVLNCSKFVLKFQILVLILSVYGVGPVFWVDWLIACSDSENGSTSNHHTSPSSTIP